MERRSFLKPVPYGVLDTEHSGGFSLSHFNNFLLSLFNWTSGDTIGPLIGLTFTRAVVAEAVNLLQIFLFFHVFKYSSF